MSENAKILLDIEEEKPILDFDKYVSAASSIIQNTDARFSIGIYGEWGTGKTTLMKGIQKKIKDRDNIITVWFDAWRYENEEHHAAIPLLKKIAYTIEKDPDFKSIADKIKTVVGVIGRDITSSIISSFFSGIDIKKMKDEFDKKMSVLLEYEKNTIFYDGLELISAEIERNPGRKIAVFIDDLDRCSPEKTIQVLESTKAFLDIKGFVFVIGLSHDTTADLITKHYEKIGIQGKDYIKKIIQVPFHIQEWNHKDTITLLQNMASKLQPYYTEIIQNEEDKDKLLLALEKNPREIKRFFNSFIISNEIYFKENRQFTSDWLMLHAFKFRWPKIYKLFTTVTLFKDEIDRISNLSSDERKKIISSKDPTKIHEERQNYRYADEIEILLDDDDFWEFMNG